MTAAAQVSGTPETPASPRALTAGVWETRTIAKNGDMKDRDGLELEHSFRLGA